MSLVWLFRRGARWCAAVLVAAMPAGAAAQTEPGTRLEVQVAVENVTIVGDIVEIEYRLRNAASSTEDLFTFTVATPTTPVMVELPAPADAWATATQFRGMPVARWTALEPVVAPGADSPVLRMRVTGLPAIAHYWIQGYAPPPPLTEDDTAAHVEPADPLAKRSRTGHTIGVEAVAPGTSAAILADRLDGLTAAVCGELGWINSEGVCESLSAKLDAARAAVVNDRASAIYQLGAYINELEAQNGLESGNPVSDEACLLLRRNAEALLARL